MRSIFLLFISTLIVSSCVPSKKLKQSQANEEQLTQSLTKCKQALTDCQNSKDDILIEYKSKINEIQNSLNTKDGKVKSLEEQIELYKKTNTNLLDRLSDLSVISKTGAESIKQSLDAMNEKDRYIKDLTSSISKKDSINMALVMNLKRSLSNENSEDVNIEVKKGVVYISLSDKMLFKSGSAMINEQANSVLEKISKILNDQKDLDILIEGHTDNVPMNSDCISDNWDLSTRRSTAIVRLLQKKYNVDPSRMTAGGRSEYLPKVSNDTAEGRKTNRRTEIIILPKLDQFFKLMTPTN